MEFVYFERKKNHYWRGHVG